MEGGGEPDLPGREEEGEFPVLPILPSPMVVYLKEEGVGVGVNKKGCDEDLWLGHHHQQGE